MSNIKFNYLYRDGANYKNYSFVIFYNPNNISLKYLQEIIPSKLIYGEWFYVNEWKLPDLHFGRWDNEVDHTFHECESIEYSNDAPNTIYTLEEFIEIIKVINNAI